jgi:hypothetical protein
MAKPIKKSHRREAPAPPDPGSRVAPAPRDGGSKASRPGAAYGASRGAYSRGGAHSATHTTNHRAHAGEPRDRSAGRLRPSAGRPMSEAVIVARTMTRGAMCARWVDGSNSTATMASRSRCFRFPRKPRGHGALSGRDANRRRRIRRRRKPGAELFLAAKS